MVICDTTSDIDVTNDVNDDGVAAVVKDPVSLEYFQIGARERFVLEQLREPRTLRQLHEGFQKRFPNERVSEAELLGFCSALRDSSLLDGGPVDSSGRNQLGGASPLVGGLLQPLSLRLFSFDASWLLGPLAWFGRVACSRWGAALFAAFAGVVGVQLVGRAPELVAELPRLIDLARPRYLILTLVTTALVKGWHEIGHGLACRRFGAECSEMGVLLLAGVPTLYCDTSDAWTIADRWRRAAVALAGVYFEGILATVAAVAWMLLEPSAARTACVNVMVVATISTLVVNLNPLMRYDGYYLLADLWGVPNLHRRSRSALWGPVSRWIVGGRRGDYPQRGSSALAAYAVVSIAYSLAMLALILFGAHQLLSEWSLRPLGDAVVTATLLGVVFGTARAIGKALPRSPAWRLGAALRRATLVAVASVAALVAIASLRFEQSLLAPCRLEGEVSTLVAAPIAGVIVPNTRYGAAVRRGDAICLIEDPSQDIRRLELREEIAACRGRLRGLRVRSQRDPQLFHEIGPLEAKLRELARNSAALDAEAERRVVRSPTDGVLLPPTQRRSEDDAELSAWIDAPLEPWNRGCRIESGEVLAVVATARQRAVLLLDHTDSGRVLPGQAARVALDRAPGFPIQGSVAQVALAATEENDARRANTESAALESTLRDPLQRGRTYRVAVDLPTQPAVATPGAIGQARIVTGRESLGERVERQVRRAFGIEG
ncbi:MAG: hypothetical protein ACRCT8_12845 [Lacipirellulaceae bacterium]